MNEKQKEIYKILDEEMTKVYNNIPYIEDMVGDEFIDDFDTLTENLEDAGYFIIEVIYYAKAMDILKENDASLKESLKLAHDLGFTADNLNSEILASILMNEIVREEWWNLREKFDEMVEELGDGKY